MERHTRVLQIAGESGSKSVLFDFLESDPPTFEVKQAQQQVNAELKALALRVAVLVSDYRLAYHGRIAFGDSSHRIVYDDMEEAILWLTQGGAQDEDRPA